MGNPDALGAQETAGDAATQNEVATYPEMGPRASSSTHPGAAGAGTAGAGTAGAGTASNGTSGAGTVDTPGTGDGPNSPPTDDTRDASNAALEEAITSLASAVAGLKDRDDVLKSLMASQLEAMQELGKRDAGRAKSLTSAVSNLNASIRALDSRMDNIDTNMKGVAERMASDTRLEGRTPPLQKTTSNIMDSASDGSGSMRKVGSQPSSHGSAPRDHVPTPPTLATRLTDKNPVFETFAYTSSGSRSEADDMGAAKLKPTKPPAFDGDCTKISVFDWAAMMDLYVRAFGTVTLDQILQTTLSNLTGAASTWAWDRIRAIRTSGHTTTTPWPSMQAFYADLARTFHRSDNLAAAYDTFLAFSLNGYTNPSELRNALTRARLDARQPTSTVAQHVMHAIRRDWGPVAAGAISNTRPWRELSDLMYQNGAGGYVSASDWDIAFENFIVNVLDTGIHMGTIGKTTSPARTYTSKTYASHQRDPGTRTIQPVMAFFRKYREHHGAERFKQLLEADRCLNCGQTGHQVKDCPSPPVCAIIGNTELAQACSQAGLPPTPPVFAAMMQAVDNEHAAPPPIDPSEMDTAALVAHVQSRIAAETGGDHASM